MWKSWLWGTVVIKHRAEGTSSQHSGMSTAAGLIGLCSSVITWTALDVRGHSVMTAGLKGGDGRVHFGRIKFRNKLSNWPWNWEEYKPSISQLGHRMFFSRACLCGCMFLLLVNKYPAEYAINLCLSWVIFQGNVTGKGAGAAVRDMNPSSADTRGNPLEVLGCIQSSFLQTKARL